ncbi:transporter substrate-binding domain-containing protein [Chromobacterium piscinae]|uniref:substrate-binding periplasmic protein n=1 Tax=Chromobacterium piscinae TaxID=686831 RepID=UPI0032079702
MPHALTHKLLLASLLLAAPRIFPAEPIRLATHLQPPLSFTRDNGQADGLTVQVVDCALKKMQRPYTLDFVPWPRAQWQVQHLQSDGFFAATQSEERDRYATLSAPLIPYERRWYLLKANPLSPSSPEFKRQARIAAFSGSNMDIWLRDHGYRLSATPGNSEQLLRMLQSRRVDAVLGNSYAVDALSPPGTSDRAAQRVGRSAADGPLLRQILPRPRRTSIPSPVQQRAAKLPPQMKMPPEGGIRYA